MRRSQVCAVTILLVGWFALSERPALGQYIRSGDPEWDQTFDARWQKLNSLAQEGKLRACLKEVAWLLDNRPGSFPEFDRSPTRILITYVGRVQQYYAPAEKWMKRRRASMEKAFRAGKGDLGKGHELNEINKQMGDWGRTLELYDELGEEGKKGARMQRELFLFVEASLLEEDRYEELLTGAGDGPGSLEARFEKLERHFKRVQNIGRESIDKARWKLCRSAAMHYEAMLKTGKREEAGRLAEKYMAFHKCGATYVLFIRHAVAARKHSTARKIAKRAKSTLPRIQYLEVEEEAKLIPKKKKKKKRSKRKKRREP